MKFIDEAIITAQSGDGGSGCVSFRREKYVPKGGPDGGDGGKGGDVVFRATLSRRTLQQFRFKRLFKAPDGGPGQGRQKAGRQGENLVIEVPLGTLIFDLESGQLLKDLAGDDEAFRVARGGRGGLGNTHFKSATNRTPRFAQPGEPGETRSLKLELKLLADVGLIGLPNAGKSTLIRAISAARPKTADYPFTTLTPNLGVVSVAGAEPFVVADIPGLIDGAHQGAGLGHRFLKHIERTRLLVHLIDASGLDPEHPLEAFETINRELRLYKLELAHKPQLVVLNKMDLPETEAKAQLFTKAAPALEILCISAVTHQGLKQLTTRMLTILEQGHEPK